MRILLTTIFEIPHEGGLSTHLLTLKDGLERLGHEVDILSISQTNKVLKYGFSKLPGFVVNKIKPGQGQIINDKNKQKILASDLKKQAHNYDVINAQDIFAALAAAETRTPTVLTVHGYYCNEAISRGAIPAKSPQAEDLLDLERLAYKSATSLVTVDERIKKYLKKVAGVKATALQNFINLEKFQAVTRSREEILEKYKLKEDAKILFVPRRLTAKNGVIYPVLALRQILAQFPETVLIYAGTGEERPHLKKLIADNYLGDHVRLLGSVAHEEMFDLYKIADLVLIPSVNSYDVEEATSIAALEAMSSGSPVLASAIGGLKEIIIDQVDGILLEEKNSDQIAEAAIKILQEKRFAQQLATAAQEKIAKNHSHLVAAENYLKIYKQASKSFLKKEPRKLKLN